MSGLARNAAETATSLPPTQGKRLAPRPFPQLSSGMAERRESSGKGEAKSAREKRLAAALRENLRRRKAQERSRSEPSDEKKPEPGPERER